MYAATRMLTEVGCVECRPSVWTKWVDSIRMVGLDLISFPGISCVYPNPKFYSTMTVYMAMPMFLAVICGVAWRTAKWRAHTLGLDRKVMHRKLTDHTLHTFLFILFLVYPMLSAKVSASSLPAALRAPGSRHPSASSALGANEHAEG